MVTDIDPRAVHTVAAELHREVVDIISWVAGEHGRFDARAWSDGDLEHLFEEGPLAYLGRLIHRLSTGEFLGRGGEYTDDHDLTADAFTALTMAEPWGYLAMAAEWHLTGIVSDDRNGA